MLGVVTRDDGLNEFSSAMHRDTLARVLSAVNAGGMFDNWIKDLQGSRDQYLAQSKAKHDAFETGQAADEAQYEGIAPAKGFLENAVALGANVGGTMASPENLLGAGAGGAAKTLAGTFVKDALTQAGVTAVTNPLVQMGKRQSDHPEESPLEAAKHIDLGETATAAGTAGLGAGLLGAGGKALSNKFRTGSFTTPPSAANPLLADADVAAVAKKVGAREAEEPFTVYGEGAISQKANETVQSLVDAWNPVKQFQKIATGVTPSIEGLKKDYAARAASVTPDAADPVLQPYYQARTLRSSGNRTMLAVEHEVYLPPTNDATTAQFERTDVDGLANIVKPFVDSDDGSFPNFMLYMAAKRAEAKQAQGVTTFFSSQDAAEHAQLQSGMRKILDYGDSRPDFVDAAGKMTQYTDAMLEYGRRSGVFSADDVAAIKAQNPFYVPFYRASDTESLGRAAGAVENTGGMKKLMYGSDENVAPFFDSLVHYSYNMIAGSDRNRFKLSLYDMLDKAKADGTIPAEGVAVKVSPADALKYYNILTDNAIGALEKSGAIVDTTNAQLERTTAMLGWGGSYKDADGSIVDFVYRDGKPEVYKITDPAFFDLFKSYGEEAGGLWNSWRMVAARYARAFSSAIVHAPTFMYRNAIKDTLAAGINSAFNFIPGFHSVVGIKDAMTTDVMRQALADGLGLATRTESTNLARAFADLERYGGDMTVKQYYKQMLGKLEESVVSRGWQGWSDFASKIEHASRMGERRLALKAGMSPMAAAFAGREVATDFGMRGSGGLAKEAGQVAFLNASLQGFYRFGRRMAESPGKAAAMTMGTVVLPELALWTINNEFKEYEEVPDGVKVQNFMIPMFKDWTHAEQWATGQRDDMPEIDHFFPIPKPYDYGVFGNAASALMEAIKRNDPKYGVEYALTAMRNVFPTLGEPTILSPVKEMWQNKEWTGEAITPEGVSALEPQMQARENTSPLARKLGQFQAEHLAVRGEGQKPAILLTPIEIDHLINGFLEGIANYPWQIANQIYWNIDKDEIGDMPTPRGDEMDWREPWRLLTKQFRIETPVKGSDYTQDFYKLKEEADEADKSLDAMKRTPLAMQQNKQLLHTPEFTQAAALHSIIDSRAKQLAQLNVQASRIHFDPHLSADEKRAQLNHIKELQNKITYDAIMTVRRTPGLSHVNSDFFTQATGPRTSVPQISPMNAIRGQMSKLLNNKNE